MKINLERDGLCRGSAAEEAYEELVIAVIQWAEDSKTGRRMVLTNGPVNA